jgi:hypothetical protein
MWWRQTGHGQQYNMVHALGMLEDGTNTLSQNIGKGLPHDTV